MIDLIFTELDADEKQEMLPLLTSISHDIDIANNLLNIKSATLEFYKDFKLYKITNSARRTLQTLYVLYKSGDPVLLDWTNEPIYAVNERAPIILNETTCASYVQFFLHFARGRLGAFNIVETQSDVEWLPSVTEESKITISGKIAPLVYNGIDTEHFHSLSGTIIFHDALFRADVKIAPYEMDVFNSATGSLDHFSIGQIRIENQEIMFESLSDYIRKDSDSIKAADARWSPIDKDDLPVGTNLTNEWLAYLHDVGSRALVDLATKSTQKDGKMIFYKEERTALFIDGTDLYNSAKKLQFDVDFKRLLEVFAGRGRLIRAYYYGITFEDTETVMSPLFDWLRGAGYNVRTRRAELTTDSSGRTYIRDNLSMDLVLDVMQMSENIQHVVIFSGDKHLRRLVEFVQLKGLRVSIVSTIRTSPQAIDDELRYQADNFIELHDLMPHVARSKSERED